MKGPNFWPNKAFFACELCISGKGCSMNERSTPGEEWISVLQLAHASCGSAPVETVAVLVALHNPVSPPTKHLSCPI